MKKLFLVLIFFLSSIQVWSQTEDSILVWFENIGGNRMDVSPDGQFFALAGDDGNVWVHYTSDARLLIKFNAYNNHTYCVKYSPDGQYIVTCGDYEQTIKIWKTSDWSLFRSIDLGYSAQPMYVCFSHNNKFIAACIGNEGFNIWDFPTCQLVKNIQPEYGGLDNGTLAMSIEFSPNDSLLGLSSRFNYGRVYDFYKDSTIVHSYPESRFSTFSRDGKKFIANFEYDDVHSNYGQGVCIFDIESGTSDASFQLYEGIRDADVSFDNKYIVFGLGTSYIYDISLKKIIKTIPYSCYLVKFIPNTNFLLCSGEFCTFKLNFDKLTGVYELPQNLTEKILSINPNPSNNFITIKYQIDNPKKIKIIIVDINGNTISKLYENMTDSGIHNLTWDISTVPDGIYFAKLVLPNSFDIQKIIVNK